jgi:hypothetical protein
MYPDHSCDAVFVELGTGLELGEPSGGIGPDHRTDHRGIRHAALRMCARLALLGLTVAQVATAQDGWRTLPRALWISGFGASAGLQSFGSSGSLGTLVAGPGYGIRLGWSGDSSLASITRPSRRRIRSSPATMHPAISNSARASCTR